MSAQSVPAAPARRGGKPVVGRNSPDYSLKRGSQREGGVCCCSCVSQED